MRWLGGLKFRVLAFLTVTLLPLGVVGLVQTAQVKRESDRRAELSLLALTELAASGERQAILEAFGAADTLGDLIGLLREDPEACRRYLNTFLEANGQYAFVGFIEPDGISRCSSVARELDLSGDPNIGDVMANPRRNIGMNLTGAASGKSVMIINQPVFDDDRFIGYTSLSLPLSSVAAQPDVRAAIEPIALITFNTRGQVLSAENGREQGLAMLPESVALSSLVAKRAHTFRDVSGTGEKRIFAVTPIVPGVAYALSAWRKTSGGGGTLLRSDFAGLIPLSMWLASLFVTWFALDRLILTRVIRLNRAMAQFAQDRTLPNLKASGTGEFGKLESSFREMSEDIVRDEALAEDRLREKNMLLKEVHHRVKNNLQIISSIINMQIRKARAPEAKHVMSSVQDRIQGLSAVHRTLNTVGHTTHVDARSLVSDILEQTEVVGLDAGQPVNLTTSLDSVILLPDQAVPFSMLLSEALTNATKYTTPDAQGQRQLSVTLTRIAQGQVRLTVENSAQDAATSALDATSSGLGGQLIRAFASQLDAQLTVTHEDGVYRLELVFTVEVDRPDTQDY